MFKQGLKIKITIWDLIKLYLEEYQINGEKYE
jgi:hypothetical protein